VYIFGTLKIAPLWAKGDNMKNNSLVIHEYFPNKPLQSRDLLIDFFETPLNNVLNDFFNTKKSFSLTGSSYPKMDISEDSNSFYIKCAVPGVKLEDLTIESDKSTRIVTIKGQSIKSNFSTENDKDNVVYVKELKTSSFGRSVKLPDYVDMDNCEAELADGILSLTFNLYRVLENVNENVKKIEIKKR